MPYRMMAASIAALSVVAGQTAHAAANCWNVEESRAAQIQDLNTLLMIEELKCEKTIPAIKAHYDAFVTKNRDAVVRSKRTIQGYFVDRTGAEAGQTDYLNYETALANELSSPAASYDRCEDMVSFMRMAANAEDSDLLALAHVLAASRIIVACPAPTRPMAIEMWNKQPRDAALAPAAVAEPGAPIALAAAPAPIAPAPSAAAEPAVAAATPAAGDKLELVDGVPTITPAVAVAASEPAQPVAGGKAGASAPVTEPAVALQAAAQALALAAQALKAAPGPAAPAIAAVN